jgi:hypothetical protein
VQHDTEKYRQIFESMPSEEIEDMNRKNDEESHCECRYRIELRFRPSK